MLHNTKARSSGTREITVLMPHAEVVLRVAAPGHLACRVGWFQGMEGFTGWHSGTRCSMHA